jgi:hypothetical protein
MKCTEEERKKIDAGLLVSSEFAEQVKLVQEDIMKILDQHK